MSQTIFIADLHLDNRYPKALSAFCIYLENLKKDQVDALYILGDLFEYWLGDDCSDKTAKTVAKALSDYHNKTHTPLYFIHGNRDFLLGEDYAKQCKMQILPEHMLINLYGVETLVLHGDTLCTDDVAYMRFRETVHRPEWQARILRLPLWVRRLKALHLRYHSKKANAQKSEAVMDVSHNTVIEMVRKKAIKQMIHGHTHRPAIHHFEVDGQPITRCVVGDWYTQGSVLQVTPDTIQLSTLPFSN